MLIFVQFIWTLKITNLIKKSIYKFIEYVKFVKSFFNSVSFEYTNTIFTYTVKENSATFIKKIQPSSECSEYFNSLGQEGSYGLWSVLHCSGNKGHILSPHLKRLSNWDSLHYSVVMQSASIEVFERCSL